MRILFILSMWFLQHRPPGKIPLLYAAVPETRCPLPRAARGPSALQLPTVPVPRPSPRTPCGATLSHPEMAVQHQPTGAAPRGLQHGRPRRMPKRCWRCEKASTRQRGKTDHDSVTTRLEPTKLHLYHKHTAPRAAERASRATAGADHGWQGCRGYARFRSTQTLPGVGILAA